MILDTSVLIWFHFGDRQRLGETARRAIDEAWANGDAAVSAITFWEVALLHRKRRLNFHVELGSWRAGLLDNGLVEIPIDGDIGIRSVLLPDFHDDPADRLIVATALTGHRLVTSDHKILRWAGHLSRLDARK